MKKLYNLWLIACLVCLLSSCAAGQLDSTEGPSRGPTWQEQCDLGIRYLSEGNYEEAILAFTAAIEIDPKQAPAYVGRGDAYALFGETEENLAAALADYEKALELDETNAEAYLGLADVYIRQGDYEKAREILAKGVDKTGSEALQEMLDGIFVEEVDANGFNAYGATAFTQREEYIPFTELTAEVQTFIASATTAVMGNDRDTLLALSETVALDLPIQMELSSQLYTVWNQHKIGVHISEIGLDSEGAYLNYFWKIEIRPQNGMGYYSEILRKLGFSDIGIQYLSEVEDGEELEYKDGQYFRMHLICGGINGDRPGNRIIYLYYDEKESSEVWYNIVFYFSFLGDKLDAIDCTNSIFYPRQ